MLQSSHFWERCPLLNCETNLAQMSRRRMGAWQGCKYLEGEFQKKDEKGKDKFCFFLQEISWTRGPHMESLTTAVAGSLPPHFLSNDTVKVIFSISYLIFKHISKIFQGLGTKGRHCIYRVSCGESR